MIRSFFRIPREGGGPDLRSADRRLALFWVPAFAGNTGGNISAPFTGSRRRPNGLVIGLFHISLLTTDESFSWLTIPPPLTS
ncbi:MAG: hypothetical protein RLZZ141_2298 [Pseudomonadota bacterium]